ncbi:unnamed protein product [Thelazia callipaeda]|uniref:IDEAL domain-containing protein n=1 Tax=Thelazia callipaeda TaxID=103827 RepID=A0A0N5DCE0_THECL|nr:unnamed protein product [Thelazia callipaeda]
MSMVQMHKDLQDKLHTMKAEEIERRKKILEEYNEEMAKYYEFLDL